MSKGARVRGTPKKGERRDTNLLPLITPHKYRNKSKYTGSGERKEA